VRRSWYECGFSEKIPGVEHSEAAFYGTDALEQPDSPLLQQKGFPSRIPVAEDELTPGETSGEPLEPRAPNVRIWSRIRCLVGVLCL
jgi:hypothetical protein